MGARPGKHSGRSASGRQAGNPPTPLDADGQSIDVADGWACKTAGSSRVSSTVVHVSKCGLGTQRRDMIADRPPGTADHSPTSDMAR